MTLKVVDRFTTIDGEWFESDKPHSITKEQLEKYGGWDIPGKGAAAHIFVHYWGGGIVKFYKDDGLHGKEVGINQGGWANFPIFASSAFWAVDNGPWAVSVNGIEVARGLGLPDGLHVSTFLIVEDVDSGSQPLPDPTWPEGYINITAFAREIKITGPDGKVILDWRSE